MSCRMGSVRRCERTVKGARLDWGYRKKRTRSSTPDDALLIEEVIDYFDTVTHLNLGLFGHGEDGTNQLARFDVVERRNPVRPTLFQLLSVTCHSCLLFL